MAEQLLHDAEFGAAVEQVRGEGVAEQVGMDTLVDTGGERVTADDQLDGALREAPTAPVQEQRARGGRVLLARAVQRTATTAEVTIESGAGRLAHHDHALLVAFAGDDHRALLQVDGAHVETGGFAHSETAGVHRLE